MIQRSGPGAVAAGDSALATHYAARIGDQIVLSLQRCEDEDRRLISESVMSGREALVLAADLIRLAATVNVRPTE